MSDGFYCPRCGLGGLRPRQGWAACGRCGNRFAVPDDATANAIAGAGTASAPPRTVGYDVATGALLYLFAPVGLALLWSHPTWPRQRKILLTAVVVGAWGLLLAAGIGMTIVHAVRH